MSIQPKPYGQTTKIHLKKYLYEHRKDLPAYSALQAQVQPINLPEPMKEVLTSYEQHWEGNNAKALAALFTEDGFILRPGHPPVQGRGNIEEAYAKTGSRLVLRAYDYGIAGDQAYILGGYAGHETWPEIGKFTLVLKKVDGQWFIHSDMDNRNKQR